MQNAKCKIDDLVPLESIADDEIAECREEIIERTAAARERRSRQETHLVYLILCSLALVVAFCLQNEPHERVALRGYPNLKLPPSCLTREYFGFPCPGCGLTRSFVALAHGDFRQSWAMHRLGCLLAAVFVVQIPYRIYCLRHLDTFELKSRWADYFSWSLIAGLIGNWIFNVLAIP